ncbi:MAG: GtrA family protein [Pseudomonadota bacterium]
MPIDATPRQLIATARAWTVAFVTTPGRLKEFCRYTGVSAVSLGLDIAVFAALQVAAIMSAPMAGAWSCMAGLLLHYFLSVHVVFDPRATGKSDRRLLSEYAATGAMGFAITASSIFVIVEWMSLPSWFGKFVGIGLTFVTVYLVRAGVVFAPKGGLLAAVSQSPAGKTHPSTTN